MKRVQDNSLYLEVLVRSEVRLQLANKGILEFRQNTTQLERQQVGILAAALAEGLCEKYSDTLDPSTVALCAMQAHEELLQDPHLLEGDELPRYADARMAQ